MRAFIRKVIISVLLAAVVAVTMNVPDAEARRPGGYRDHRMVGPPYHHRHGGNDGSDGLMWMFITFIVVAAIGSALSSDD